MLAAADDRGVPDIVNRYDHAPQCAYGSSGLDFAIHVRLGDRAHMMNEENDNYFRLLEGFMEVVTGRVLARGYDAPVFHVFSETSLPCPTSGNGTFMEFPHWPVEIDQVRNMISRSAIEVGKSRATLFCINKSSR